MARLAVSRYTESMTRIEILEDRVRSLYAEKNPNRADWADWLAENHVFVVANYASALAKRFGANEELARAAAILHDIADVKMSRFDEAHATVSLELARELMQNAEFSEDEIRLVVDDGIRYHSCHDGERPESLEGKILATADSIAHLASDFYIYAVHVFTKDGKSLDEIKGFAHKKIERDFNDKILFDEIKNEYRTHYEQLKILFK